MQKSTHTPLYDAFRARMVSLRKNAGMSQRDLAKRLDVPRSFVSRIELGERRLDLVEVYWLCNALGVCPMDIAIQCMKEFKRLEKAR